MPPEGAVARALEYVGLLFLLCLAGTFPFWAAAQAARSEYRLSALAFSMRVFFYSICLLCILVALRSFDLAPRDPRSTLFGWIHLGGTVLMSRHGLTKENRLDLAPGTDPTVVEQLKAFQQSLEQLAATTTDNFFRLFTTAGK